MTRAAYLLVTVLSGGAALPAMQQPDEPVVFRSDVSLVRVDAQVLDRDNRAITGLRVEDFVLREGGQRREIRNFAREEMPIDVLFLLDVSASMRPHVQRIASAAHQALRVLGDKDRVAIMVFDRATRVRLPFRGGRTDVEREFETLLRQESFRGGTDITRGMLDAADYISRQGRADARRAIVILTDDQTEFQRNDQGVGRALDRADAVMSALIAPDAVGQMSSRRGMGRGGIGMGGPLGGIILGGGRPPMQTGGGVGPHTRSAGTSEIALDSGGDSLPVDDASALETTLNRIRQRYALYFQLPEGARAGEKRNVQIALSDAAMRRYPGADVRYRHSYSSTTDAPAGQSTPTSVSRLPADRSDPVVADQPVTRRRSAVSGPGGSSTGPMIPEP
jgi:VWFA-related protein